ncbi:MAG: winged helix DNA-binding domain-containing protein [Actinomycetes bacterium]
MSARRHVHDNERRARLARRHGVAPALRLPDVESAVRAMTALHATETATIHLSAFARVENLTVADVERALFVDRTLVKQLAMRRTMFVLSRDLLPAVLGSASARVAERERRRVAKDVVAGGLADDGEAWLERACAAVLERLAAEPGDEGLSAQEIREQVPEVKGSVTMAPGKTWGGDVNVAPWVLTQLGARGQVVRGVHDGHWRTARPRWTLMSHWLGEQPEPWSPVDGYAELVRRWLWTFGPGTTDDLQWWLGSTKSAVTQALHHLGAVEVTLDGGRSGWLLPDDLDRVPDVEPWAALLPVLDPTTMGWKDRGFYLHPAHVPHLFDGNGNAGTTAWWEGRVVGCWVQDSGGVVRVVLREDVGAQGRTALDAEAERLTRWLDGTRIRSVYSSRQMRLMTRP